MNEAQVLIDDLMFGEGPRWRDGRFYVSDFHAHEIVSCDLDGDQKRQHVQVLQQPSGSGWLPDGRMLVSSMLDARVLMLQDGELVEVADLSAQAEAINDMVVDARGNAYVGGMQNTFSHDDDSADISASMPDKKQCLFLVRALAEGPDRVQVAAADIFGPNGVAVTEDGGTLILSETMESRLLAWDIAEDGSLSNKRVWAELPGFPDGLCIDAENHVWLGVPYPPEAVGFYRVAEGGEIKQKIESDWTTVSCVLGGPDRNHLFMVECQVLGTGGAPELRTRGNGRVRVMRVDVPGAGQP